MKIHHIGIFCKNINTFQKYFAKNFNIYSKSKLVSDRKLGIKIKFFQFSGSNQLFEIVEPLGKINPISKVLKNKTNIINHIAFLTTNFESDIQKLIKKNCYPLTNILYSKYFNSNIVFLMSPFNFIIELIKNDKNKKIRKKK